MLNLYSSSPEGRIFVGVTGWNDPEWRKLLGAEETKSGRSVLTRLTALCDLVEINAAYYHPPEARTVRTWLAEVQSDKPFCFTLRLWNKLVRERALLLQNDIRLMKAALTPLQEAGKLGAVVVQVMPSMRYSESNELWLLGLLDQFAEFPLFVENLHASWEKSDTLLRLQDRNAGIAEALEALEAGASTFASVRKLSVRRMMYFRGRGRNESAALGAPTEARYSAAEIASLAQRLKTMLPYLSHAFVVFNNHAHGHSLLNALQLRHALGVEAPNLPRTLLDAFPALHAVASNSVQQRDLFEERV